MTAPTAERPRWLTKHVFLQALECPRRGWLLHHAARGESMPGLGAQFRLAQGNDIGDRARALFAPGVDLRGPATPAWVSEGARCLDDPSTATLFEVPVLAGHAMARPDVLVRDAGGWRVIEVKSAKTAKPELVDDLAYTVAVVQAAGLPVTGAELALVNPDWRVDNGAPPVVRHDVSDKALARAGEFAPILETIYSAVSADAAPPAMLAAVCRNCDFRGVDCFVDGPRDPVFELPGIRSRKVDDWIAGGITRIVHVPESEKLTPVQAFHRRAVLAGDLVTDAAGLARLRDVREPAAYLDFETLSLALPPFPGVAPYDVLPIQYSLHRRTPAGLEHAEWLLDPARPDLEQFTRRLLDALAGAASIVVYSSFERLRLEWLAARYPQHADALADAVARLVDLLPIVQSAVAHPNFHGSLSIKKVLPVFVDESELTYRGLEIANGDDATGAAGLRAMGRIADAEWDRCRAQLLAYCRVDTLAMVRLHEALLALAP
ncbi:MAG: DUF2779 domain-containing protein [Gemmatimonadota bacterium]|nr:DUF2779 domain-containing protein [Gemmatimonadota bacterium]